ncbi:class I SAM-dependent methyltransferase [Myxococcota bacterium]|nr:class I SAM-dependent methyltransferase [Myxococcota bacterium]
MRLYDDLSDCYDLLDPRDEHEDEATEYGDWLRAALGLPSDAAARPSLLELGAGAGNNAWYLRRRFDCTLSDVSEAMLDRSRAQNPDCIHAQGDMRTLRLGRTFDAVFIHDAIGYMATRDDLRAALRTAFEHTRPGGVALFVPDHFREDLVPGVEPISRHVGGRGLEFVEWSRDPDPDDETFIVDYGGLYFDGREMRALHDQHVQGLFPRAVWLELLAEVGFDARVEPREVEDGYAPVVLVARRP